MAMEMYAVENKGKTPSSLMQLVPEYYNPRGGVFACPTLRADYKYYHQDGCLIVYDKGLHIERRAPFFRKPIKGKFVLIAGDMTSSWAKQILHDVKPRKGNVLRGKCGVVLYRDLLEENTKIVWMDEKTFNETIGKLVEK